MIDPELKQYLETDFTFKLIVGMSKVFITREEFRAEMQAMETRLENKIEWLARMIHNDIAIPHEKRLLALEERTQNL